MELNKEQRHEVYKKALEKFEHEFKIRGGTCGTFFAGICSCVIWAADILFPNGTYEGYFIEDLIDFLPELQQRKPDWAEMDNFWWHIDDSAIRIKVLNELIEETK